MPETHMLMSPGQNQAAYSEQVRKLKVLLLRDEERRKRMSLSWSSSLPEAPSEKELEPLVQVQSTVERKLEEQVQFYQRALEELKRKSEIIVSENQGLYERMREQASNPMSNLEVSAETAENAETTETEGSNQLDAGDLNDVEAAEDEICHHVHPPKERLLKTKSEYDGVKPGSPKPKKSVDTSVYRTQEESLANFPLEQMSPERLPQTRFNMDHEMSKMRTLYENKSKHLEALLKSARSELDAKQSEVQKLKSEMKLFKTPERDIGSCSVACPNCTARPRLSLPHPEAKVIERLTIERDELCEAVNKQKQLIAEGKRKESEACLEVKKSCDLVEQALLEKQEAVIQSRQLREDLRRQQEFHNSSMKSAREKADEEHRKKQSEMQYEIDSLGKKVDEVTCTLAATEVQLERATRDKVGLKTELEQLKVHIFSQKAESDSDIDRLTLELQEARRRLETTEGNLRTLQDEQLTLTDDVNKLKRELNSERLRCDASAKLHDDERSRLIYEASQREQEMALLLQEAETRYGATKSELTNLLDTQIAIANKFKAECKSISERLDLERNRFSEKTSRLAEHCEALEKHLGDIVSQQKLAEAEKENHEKEHAELLVQTKIAEEFKVQVVSLMNKQNALLRERHLLCQEVEFLRAQLQEQKTAKRSPRL